MVVAIAGDAPDGATVPVGVLSSSTSVHVRPVAVSVSSWKFSAVSGSPLETEDQPWMPAIDPGPPVEPMLTVVAPVLEMLTGSLSVTTLTMFPGAPPSPVVMLTSPPVPVLLTVIVSESSEPMITVDALFAVPLTWVVLLLVLAVYRVSVPPLPSVPYVKPPKPVLLTVVPVTLYAMPLPSF